MTSGSLLEAKHILKGYDTQTGCEPTVSEIYELLRHAAARRQPVAATYDGQPRLLCPHVLGRKSGRLHVLFYQFGGSSNSGLPIAPEGGVSGAASPWRNSARSS